MRAGEIMRLTTWGDRVLIIVLGILTIAALPLMGAAREGANHVVIEVDGKRVKTISLKGEGTHTVKGPDGDAVFEVKDGKIRAVTAPCDNKVCISQGWTNAPWKLLVCVPNKMVVRPLDKGMKDDVDGVTW